MEYLQLKQRVVFVSPNVSFSKKIMVNIILRTTNTVVPVMNGHPRDQAKVSVHCRWPLIRGDLTLKCVGRGIDYVAIQGRWPLTTGVAQGRYAYYCSLPPA